jgi:hypothetical protein
MQIKEEVVMNKIVTILLAVFVFSWASVVSAGPAGPAGNWPVKESPESIVTCGAGNGETIAMQSVYGAINVEQCKSFENTCAPCISSLEGQGCKIVDVVVTHVDFHTTATYLLSCDGR